MRGEVNIYLLVLKAPVNNENSLIISLHTTALSEVTVLSSWLPRNSRKGLLSQSSIWNKLCPFDSLVRRLICLIEGAEYCFSESDDSRGCDNVFCETAFCRK